MNKITTCLWFDGLGEAAAKLYTTVFPDSHVGDVTRYGPGEHGLEGSVMTVSFELNGQQFVALNGGPAHQFSEAISFQVSCADQDEVDHYWGALSDGGEEGPCGWLKDRFGVSWQIIPTRLNELISDPDPEKSRRVVQAMLSMKKIDIAGLELAAGVG